MSHFKVGQKVRFLGTDIEPRLPRGGAPSHGWAYDTARRYMIPGQILTVESVIYYDDYPDSITLVEEPLDIHDDCWFEPVEEPDLERLIISHFKVGQKVRFLGTDIEPVIYDETKVPYSTTSGLQRTLTTESLAKGSIYTVGGIENFINYVDSLFLTEVGDIDEDGSVIGLGHECCWFEPVEEPDLDRLINFCLTGQME